MQWELFKTVDKTCSSLRWLYGLWPRSRPLKVVGNRRCVWFLQNCNFEKKWSKCCKQCTTSNVPRNGRATTVRTSQVARIDKKKFFKKKWGREGVGWGGGGGGAEAKDDYCKWRNRSCCDYCDGSGGGDGGGGKNDVITKTTLMAPLRGRKGRQLFTPRHPLETCHSAWARDALSSHPLPLTWPGPGDWPVRG